MFEYIKINDKKMACKFGFNALRHFSKETGTSIQDMGKIGNDMTFETAIQLIYCGLKDGARAAKDVFTYTIDDLGDDLDYDMEAIERCMTLFTEQMGNGANDKKKVKAKGVKKVLKK